MMLKWCTNFLMVIVCWLAGCNTPAGKWTAGHKNLKQTKEQSDVLHIDQVYLQSRGRVVKGQTFDKLVSVEADATSIVFENNIFNRGIRVAPSQEKRRMEYRNNLIRDRDGIGLSMNYGDLFVDNVMVIDFSGWNPHFILIDGGKGETIFRGNVFWFTEPNGDSMAEGDGILILETDEGTREENHVIIERNIFLPNSTGPNGEDSLSCTAFTLMCRQLNCRVSVRRNTIFTHVYGGCNVGENWVTRAGAVEAVKSNLFVGDINHQGSKIRNLGEAETDVILAENADYNACYRCADGSHYSSGAGKGYHYLDFSDSDLIGEHDLDDLDPQFVDWTRNPTSWDASLGGPGTMDSVVARLEPGGGHTIQELLDYIQEGYRPQNLAYQAAGDPADGSPDIGAVDLFSEYMTISLPASAREGDGLLKDQGVVTLSMAPTSALAVTLNSSDTSELTVPPSITVSAGTARTQFDLQVIQDQELDGDQTVRVTARVSGYASGSDTMDILDDDRANDIDQTDEKRKIVGHVDCASARDATSGTWMWPVLISLLWFRGKKARNDAKY